VHPDLVVAMQPWDRWTCAIQITTQHFRVQAGLRTRERDRAGNHAAGDKLAQEHQICAEHKHCDLDERRTLKRPTTRLHDLRR
jgi:hypothetical protein